MPRDLVVLSLAQFTWGIGEGMFIYFQPLNLQQWGAEPIQIGMILSLMGIAMAVAQVPAGFLSDRVGSRPVMRSAWVLGCIATVLMALAGTLPVFVAGLMVYSVTSFVSAPMNSYIASMRGRWSVERAVTISSAAFHLGTVAGPLLGGWFGQVYGLQSVFRVSAVIFLFSTLIVFQARRPVEQETQAVSAAQPRLLANPRFLSLLVMLFFTMFALQLPQPLTSIYLENQRGVNVQQIGQIGSVASLSNAAVMLALGGLRAPVGMLTGQVMVGLFALLMWQGTGMPFYYLGYFFLGGFRLCRSMALAYARSMINIRETGLAFGMVETATATSVILAPAAAGILYQRGPQWMYIASLAAIGVMLVLNIQRLLVQRRAAGAVETNRPDKEQWTIWRENGT